jgi:hypothetical protein
MRKHDGDAGRPAPTQDRTPRHQPKQQPAQNRPQQSQGSFGAALADALKKK